MKEIQDMTDEEYRLYKAQRWAARWFRTIGLDELAERVEGGELDECAEMQLGRFFNELPQPLTAEFIDAWNQFVAEREGMHGSSS